MAIFNSSDISCMGGLIMDNLKLNKQICKTTELQEDKNRYMFLVVFSF